VNGTLREQSSIDQMIFSVQQQLASLRTIAALEPGDLAICFRPAETKNKESNAARASSA
jgi:hypothetical protein